MSGKTVDRSVQNGMLMMVVAMMILPGIDAVAKGLAGVVPSGQVAWSRFFFQTLLLLPFVLMSGELRAGRRLWAHAARGFLIALATVLFFTALARMPLADAIAIFFISPFISTLLGALILKEPLGIRRLAAVLVGFGGALMIIRPSYEVFGLHALLPVGTAFAFSFYMILTRTLAVGGGAIQMQFYAGVFGCLSMSIALWAGMEAEVAVLTPVWPDLESWGLLALLGVVATAGHMLIVQAVKRTGVGIVAPFQYLEIISATLLGYIFFEDFPDPVTWAGIAVIVASGLYVFHRERMLAGAPETATTRNATTGS